MKAIAKSTATADYIPLRDKIRKELQSFIELGQDLKFLREKEQELGPDKFEKWTVDESGKGVRSFVALVKRDFGLTDRTARCYIDGSDIAQHLKKAERPLPFSEWVVRPLESIRKPGKKGSKRPLDYPRIMKIWKRALDFCKAEAIEHPTEKIVKAAIESVQMKEDVESGKIKEDEPLPKHSKWKPDAETNRFIADLMERAVCPTGSLTPAIQADFLAWFMSMWQGHILRVPLPEAAHAQKAALAIIYLLDIHPGAMKIVADSKRQDNVINIKQG